MNKELFEELIEGRLCEKGLMEERYDENKNDLVRMLTPQGNYISKKLLKTKEGREILKKLENGTKI